MVRLSEWRGKSLFRKYGVPVPNGTVVRSAGDVSAAVSNGPVRLPAVVKAQVLAGGRGKGGAVRFAASMEELTDAATSLLGSEFQGERVAEVLVEEQLDIGRELYLSLTLDRARRLPILIASPEGGVEIESVAGDRILRVPIHPFAGFAAYEIRTVQRHLGVSGALGAAVSDLLSGLWSIFQSEDAELIEINPLAVVGDRVVALDAKVIIEEDAVFRHPEYAGLTDDRTPLEERAREKGIAFVQLDGDIGVIANGAGITMATLDVLQQFGGRPGIFLDLGGTDDPEKVTEAFLLMADARPRAVFLNIFGGVTRCDTVARGLVEAMKQVATDARFPLVARIRGNNEAEGIRILEEAGVTARRDMKESARAVVAAAGEAIRLAPGS